MKITWDGSPSGKMSVTDTGKFFVFSIAPWLLSNYRWYSELGDLSGDLSFAVFGLSFKLLMLLPLVLTLG
jgi:hypothetical protein